jgi:hypothetical protein
VISSGLLLPENIFFLVSFASFPEEEILGCLGDGPFIRVIRVVKSPRSRPADKRKLTSAASWFTHDTTNILYNK